MLCLDCGIVLCGTSEGRNHAKSHSVTTGHNLGEQLRYKPREMIVLLMDVIFFFFSTT